MQKIWISGARGQIGKAINRMVDKLEYQILDTDVDELDITDTDAVLRYGEMNRPDVIINCSGITNTQVCEDNPKLAFRINALGARNLSIVSKKIEAKFILHIIKTSEYGTYHATNIDVYDFPQWRDSLQEYIKGGSYHAEAGE